MRGITRDTIVELVDRKMLWLFGIVTALTCLIAFGLGQADFRLDMQTNGQFPEELQMENIVERATVTAVEYYAGLLLLLAVIATSGLIPRMLGRHAAEFYLSKPISRPALVFNKLFAVWLIYGLLLVVSLTLVSIVTALGLSYPGFSILYIIGNTLLLFAVWLSITGFVGIWSGSASVAMMAAFIIWAMQAVLSTRAWVGELFGAPWLQNIVDGLYWMLPKTGEIRDISIGLALGRPIDTWSPLWTTLLFMVVAYLAAGLLIKRKDF